MRHNKTIRTILRSTALVAIAAMTLLVSSPVQAVTWKAIQDINSGKPSYDKTDTTSGQCGPDVTYNGTVVSDANQDKIAQIIIGIAKTDNVGKAGALIGLMVGLDESSLKIYANTKVPLSLTNPAKQATGHDGYSLGVFQQQITDDWSTFSSKIDDKNAVDQLMDPAYNAEAFYGGASGPDAPSALKKGLLNHPGWENKDPWVAAQQTQVSGTPDGSNYKAQMSAATGFLTKFWDSSPAVPLPVPLTGGGATTPGGSDATITCVSSGTTSLGKGSGKFTDNTNVKEPGADTLLKRAQELNDPTSVLFKGICSGSSHCYDLCDHLMGGAWGYANSGYATAAIHWQTMLSDGHGHAGDRNVPVGALVFYATGHAAGHIAIYLGNNLVLTNDVWDKKTGRTGGAYIVPASELETGTWHLTYLGWADPIFAGGKLTGDLAF